MRTSFPTAADIPPDWWRWPHVDPAREWACKGTGRIVVEDAFLDRVEKLRRLWGRPLIISSGYRTPEHNAHVSRTGLTGPHTTARALDIRIFGHHAYAVVQLALAQGFTGIGVSQKGLHAARFIHLDDLPNGARQPRPWVWSY